jgi:hypothetical protein
MMIAAISEPIPAKGQPSSTETIRLVFLTDAATVSTFERPQRAQIECLAEIPAFLELLGGLHCQLHHARERR